MVIMLLTFILIISSTPLPPLFHFRLKTFLFLQILSTVAFLFFFMTDSMDSADCLPIQVLSISDLYFLVFLFYPLLVAGSMW